MVKGDDLMILEMLLSLPSWDIYGYVDKTNWQNNSLLAETGILWILGQIPFFGMNAILCKTMILSLQAVKQEECVLAPIVNSQTEQHVFTPYSPHIHYIFSPWS